MSDSSNGTGEPLDIRGGDALRAWLETQPAEVSVVIAVRAALRVMPMLTRDRPPTPQFAELIETAFRATATAWVIAKYPNYVLEFRARAGDAAMVSGDSAWAARAAARAANSDDSRKVAEAAARAAASAANSGSNTAAAIWTEVSADVRLVESGAVSASELQGRELWSDGTPDWFNEYRTRLRNYLRGAPHWRVWFDWYDARLKGRISAELTELAYARTPRELWDDPQQENEWIAAEIARIENSAPSIGGTSKDASASPPPDLPEPGPGPRVIVHDERIDIELHRAASRPPISKRSNALLGELREAARDFTNSFDPFTNVHSQLRNVLKRYREQIDLDDPDVNIIFALGLRLENAWVTSKRAISDRFEPELEDTQEEALLSVTRIHAVFIASDAEGAELLLAAERYTHEPADDADFKEHAEPVVELLGRDEVATEQLIEIVKGAVAEMSKGEHPARTGMEGRGFVQRPLVALAQAAINGVVGATAGQIFVHSGVGQHVIAAGAPLADKAIHFFLQNAEPLRALAAVGNQGFTFVAPVIDWIKAKLDL